MTKDAMDKKDESTWSSTLQHVVFKGYRPWFSDMWTLELADMQVQLCLWEE